MKLSTALTLVASALSLTTVACSIELGSTGDLGELNFSYPAFEPMGTPLVEGSTVTATVTSRHDARRLLGSTARVTPETFADLKTTQSCSCDSSTSDSSSSRVVACSATCNANETFTVSLATDIATRTFGDAKLEIVDAAGNLLDRTTITAHTAARIELDVTKNEATLATSAPIALRVGESVSVGVRAFDADNHPLLGDAFVVDFGTSKAVGAQTDIIANIFGQRTWKAFAAGTATVQVRGRTGSAATSAAFRVD